MPTIDLINPPASGKDPKAERFYKTWTRTPNFASIAKWDLPINYYNTSKSSWVQPKWLGRISQWTGGAVTYGTLGGAYDSYLITNGQGLGIPAGIVYNPSRMNFVAKYADPLRNELLVKALNKIANTKANLAVTLAEARKTSDLILGTANRLYRAYRSFRRGNFREVARVLNLSPKTVHKTWLEYKYGWTPLVLEVKGAAEFLAQQHLGGRPIRFYAKATGERQTPPYVETYQMGFFPNPADNVGHVETVSTTVNHSMVVKVWCEVENPHYNQLQQLGLTNPALVAWELVPFSFVFDWFISVGDWLTALTALHGISVKKAMVSGVADIEVTSTIPGRSRTYYTSGHPPSHWIKYDVPGFSWTARTRNYERESISVDPLSIYPPQNDPKEFGWERLITGLALLRARTRRLEGVRL